MNPQRANHIQEKLSLHPLAEQEAPYYASFRIDGPIDALAWLKNHCDQPTVYWCSRDGNTEYAGIGIAEPHYTSVQETQARLTELPYPLRAFGGCSFSKKSDGWGHFGQEKFWIPRILYVRQGNQYSIVHCVLSQKRSSPSKIINQQNTPTHTPPKQIWKQQIENSYEAFSSGELKKIVIARQTKVHIPKHPLDVLRTLRAQQSASFDFAFSPYGQDFFIGCSPELLLCIDNHTIQTEALAGTRPKEANPDELLHSDKDQREHRFVLNHIIERLNRLCSSTHRSAKPIVSAHNLVIHLKTSIEGIIKKGVTTHDLITALHPTPAVSGFPQQESIRLIERWEGFDRGWYAGPVGWISTNGAELAVGIRSALFQDNQCLVWAGAGIVEGSQPEQEWQEIEAKSRQFLLLAEKTYE